MSTRNLQFPNASQDTIRLNAHLFGGVGQQGMPKTPTPQRAPVVNIDEVPPFSAAGPCRFTIPGEPMGAPRQSRCDAWRPRPVVLRYRAFKDKARECAPAGLPKAPLQVLVIAYMPMPASWSKKKKNAMAGEFHRVKPDGDNIFKGAADALWEQDSCIAVSRVEKRWCWPGEERLEIEVLP